MSYWSKLSMKDRADVMKLFLDKGISDLDTIRREYNTFAGGGDKGNKPKFKKSNEAYYDYNSDTIFAPDSTGEYYHHESFHARPDTTYLQKISPLYSNLNDEKLTQMGADLPFVKRFEGDPGHFYSPEEIGARRAAASFMLRQAGVKNIDDAFLNEARKDELKYGNNFRDLLHMYNNENLLKLDLLGNQFAGGGNTNDADLVDWIIREEGFNTKPEDIGDGKITLGSGLTDPKWHALYKKKGNKWSEEDNRRAVAEEVANRRKWAEKTIPNWEALPDSSQKALLSYKYNYDFTPTNSPKLFQALADSNLKEAARQMDATSKDPKFKKGLQERRQREQEWFLSEVEPEPEPFQVVPNIIHEEIPVSTVVSTPYRTAVNNPTIPTTMIPDSNSYITTRRITPSEDRSNRVQEVLNGISDYSRLMKNTSIVNNPIPQYSPNTNIKYAEGGYLNSNNNNQPIYKDWNSLSMREKSEYMKTAIKNGITTLSDIKQAYNQFAGGGNKKEISSTTPFWQKPIIPFRQRNEVIITPDSEYNRYLNTLPDNQRFTPNDKYDSYLYWKLNGKPKDFKEAHDKGMFTYDNSDHAYHANSVAWEDEDTGYFMKPKDHDTVKYELDWFNKGLVTEEGGWQRPETLSEWRESKDFRNDYDLLDDPNRPNFYMYKHKKKAEGGNLYKKGGSKDDGYNNFVAYTQRAEGAHWQGQQDKFKREKGKSATQYYWDEAKKRYKDKWDKWTPSQRIAVADTMYNYGYWDGTFDAYKYDMNVKGVDNNAYWKKYGKGHTRRFNERKKMFYGNEVPEMIAAPKDASISIPSVQEYVEPFIPTFMPSNPEAFFTPLESYQMPIVEEVVEQPLVEAANTYSQEALDREQRQRNLNTLNFVLGMTSPQGSDNSFASTIGMLTGNINANGGNIHIKPSHRGRLTELKKRTGKSEAELYKTGGPAVRKMITFARNARKWKHGFGGNLFDDGGSYSYTKPLNNVIVDEYGNLLDPNVPSAKGTIRTPDVVIATRDPRKAVPTANSLNTSNIESTVKEAMKNYFVGNLSDDEVRRRLYHNLAPYGYTHTIARLESAIKNNTSHEFDRRHKNDRDRQDIWAEYLGIPEEERKTLFDSSTSILRDSQYSPTVGKEQNIKYKAISNPSEADVRDLIQHAEVLPIGKNKVVAGGIGHALGRYTIGHNYDNKGEYVSYYDKWDLNPFSNAGEDLSLGIGKPVNIYDRIYLDDYYGTPEEYRGSTYIPELTVTANRHANGGKIHIKPENRGKFTALKKRTGHSATWFKEHGTSAQKKMATFALNARKWKHGLGGNLFDDGGSKNVLWKK